MTSKSDKGKKSTAKTDKLSADLAEKKTSSKTKKQMEEDDEESEDGEEIELKPTSKKSGKATASKKGDAEDDEEDDGVDEKDDWEKPEEEKWDPDFEEFDIPKSKVKKSNGGKKAGDEDDLKLDEEFKEMGLFDETYGDDEEEDDY